ncbi:MAG: hypothetical protein WBE72_07540 [Terracidiphilus sp.]
MSDPQALSPIGDLLCRLRRSRAWVAAQFWLTPLLVLLGIAWTRLPDQRIWQVALTLIAPLLLLIAALELEAATMRSLVDDDGRRVKLVWGACTLLAWVALAWAAWALLDWCDDQIPEWAGYLNSQAWARARRLYSYEHIQTWLFLAEWILRWIVIPAKLIPCAMASAQWGWRLPWRKLIRLLLNWRWWRAVVLAALLGVALPGHFFAGLPQGSVAHQVWAVILKLAGAYLLAVSCWVLLLDWAAVLFNPAAPAANPDGGDSLVPIPVPVGGPRVDSVGLPLP